MGCDVTDKPASLLTKTQRRRLENEFEDVDGAKRRRDRQRIRQRVAAGLDDFEHVVTYPDGQLELAVDEFDDDELRVRLADLTLVAERVRVLRDVERDAVVETARERARAADVDDGVFDRMALRTSDERRAAIASSLADEVGPSPWKRRADLLLKIGLLFLLPAVGLGILAPELADGPVGGIPGLFGAVSLLAGLAIVGVHGVKNDLLPAIRAFVADPDGSIRSIWNRI